jgi:hypothetical protein
MTIGADVKTVINDRMKTHDKILVEGQGEAGVRDRRNFLTGSKTVMINLHADVTSLFP